MQKRLFHKQRAASMLDMVMLVSVFAVILSFVAFTFVGKGPNSVSGSEQRQIIYSRIMAAFNEVPEGLNFTSPMFSSSGEFTAAELEELNIRWKNWFEGVMATMQNSGVEPSFAMQAYFFRSVDDNNIAPLFTICQKTASCPNISFSQDIERKLAGMKNISSELRMGLPNLYGVMFEFASSEAGAPVLPDSIYMFNAKKPHDPEVPGKPWPPTAIPTAAGTYTSTPIPTPMPEASSTPTDVPTETPTSEPTATETPLPTDTPEPTATSVPTETATSEPTETPTSIPTSTPTEVPTFTPTSEPTATPIPTSTPTEEPTATETPQPTDTPEPTATPPEPTNTPEPTATPEDTPTMSYSPSSSPSPAYSEVF